MRLLFVENRYATWIYALVAKELAKEGHEIHWLIQNPMFAPSADHVWKLPFPATHSRADAAPDSYEWLRQTDRGARWFGVNTAHYSHYDRCICGALDAIRPAVVFGEATEFHELLTIRRCRERRILYLAPSATRYPPGRLAFNAFDTLDPVGGDGALMSSDDAEALRSAIVARKVVPSYMAQLPPTRVSDVVNKLLDKARITLGWIAGERFITPSPMRKLAINADRRAAYRRWERNADLTRLDLQRLLARGKKWVLYPLQMQPEGNIDVWGAPWNDQAEIVRRAAHALEQSGASLIVKPNPKSKYELLGRMNDVIDRAPNVLRASHSAAMAALFEPCPLVLTVTGTVLLEALFSGKAVVSLGTHAMATYPGVTSIAAPEDVPQVLENVILGAAVTTTKAESSKLLQLLHASSYPATLWDPVSAPQQKSPRNIEALTQAFRHVLTVAASQSIVAS